MIELTRLNGQTMVVNCDLMKYVESSPDTVLTLIHGEKIVVAETREEVIRRITAYRAALLAMALRQAGDDGLSGFAALAGNTSGLQSQASAQAELPDDSAEALQVRKRRSEQ